MKLINKISRYYLINSVILYIIAFTGIYFTLNRIISDEIDEQLRTTSDNIIRSFDRGNIINDPPLIEIIKADNTLELSFENSDTLIYTAGEKEPYRQMISFVYREGNQYKIAVRSSLIEKEDLFYSILIIFSITFAILVIVLFFINRKTTKDIFAPFYKNLNLLRNYSVKSANPLNLTYSKIDEFNELNLTLTSLSEKAGKEYKALQEFTEDLSHELQTPVSVIKSKLELLLQRDNLDEESANNLRNAYLSLNKLDKLNRSLILLAKLENKEYFESENILLNDIINKAVNNYRDFAEAQEISIVTELDSEIKVECNLSLMETVVNNLVSNSIKHNIRKGKINIKLFESTLEIRNTGEPFSGSTDKFFDRFNKLSKNSESTGLGLAIIKKICDLYRYKIEYYTTRGNHTVIIYFK